MEEVLPKELDFAYYFERLFFIFWCITVPFYFVTLCLLIHAQIKNIRDLCSPFFKLCISTAIVDLATLLNNYFGAVFPKWGLASETYLALGKPFIHVYFYIAWTTGCCQTISVSVLATNRLYAILFPNRYQKVWSGWGLKLAIFIQFSIGLLVGIPCTFDDVLWLQEEGSGLIPKIPDRSKTNLYFGIAGIVLALNSLYLIFAYCYLFYVLRNRHKYQLNNPVGNVRDVKVAVKRREFRLFLMSSCIVGIQLAIVVFFLVRVVEIIPMTTEEFYTIFNALSDINSGANPYLLWIFSDALRTHVVNMFGMKRKIVPQITVTSFAPRQEELFCRTHKTPP